MLALWETLKQWWRKLMGGEPKLAKRKHGFRVYEVARVTTSPDTDPRLLQMVTAAAMKYQRRG